MYVRTVCHQTLESEKSSLLGLPTVHVGVGSEKAGVTWVLYPRQHVDGLDCQVVVVL